MKCALSFQGLVTSLVTAISLAESAEPTSAADSSRAGSVSAVVIGGAGAGAAVPEVVVAQPAVTSAAVDRQSAAATAGSPGVIGK